MRKIVPKEISEMNKKIIPYLKFVDGVGMVLVDDAPEEIRKMKSEVEDFFRE